MTAPPLDCASQPGHAGLTLDSYTPLLGAEIEELRALARPLAGKEVAMVNATRPGDEGLGAKGAGATRIKGDTAELLNRLVPLLEELGLRPRWEVLDGDRDFFEVS